jgi:uncharacterized membrane protein YGL010W
MKFITSFTATRYSTIEQLGLYQMFHQEASNKLVHCLALPFIVYSGFIPLVGIEIGRYMGYGFDLGQFFLVFSLLFYIFLDKITTFFVALWTLPLLYAAQHTFACFDYPTLMGIVLGCQAIGWYLAVQLGHEKIESKIIYNYQEQSSNIYFEQKLFILQQLGKEPTWIDAWLQFAVGPFHSTLEILFDCGYNLELKKEIDQQMYQNLERFAKGELIYAVREEVIPN